jgi:hypothetical protein
VTDEVNENGKGGEYARLPMDASRRRALLKATAAAPVVASLYSGAAWAAQSMTCEAKFTATNPQPSLASGEDPDAAIRTPVTCYRAKQFPGEDYWEDVSDDNILYDAMGDSVAKGEVENIDNPDFYSQETCMVVVYHDSAGGEIGTYPKDVANGGFVLTPSCLGSLLDGNFTL